MARFRLAAAHTFGGKRIPAGKIVVDTAANAQPGDIIVGVITAAMMSPAMIPIDGTATTTFNASRFVGSSPPTIDGANSVEG